MQKVINITAMISIVCACIVLFYSLFIVDARIIQEIPASISVGSIIGLNAGNDLFFGNVPPGSTSIKKIILTNEENHNLQVILEAQGIIKEIITFEQTPITLKAKETRAIKIFATIPQNAKQEKYTGTIKIYSKQR